MDRAPADILVSANGPVLTITLNRPEARNALRTQLLQELSETIEEAGRNDLIRAVVLTGGTTVFAAGADLKELDFQRTDPDVRVRRNAYWRMFGNFEKPIIAAVNGYCLGGGNELAMLCDIIVAGESAKLGQTEINVGLIPGAGGVQRLTRALGKAKAMRYILGGEMITAAEAFQAGLVSEVVPDDQTIERAQAIAQKLAEKAPLALKLAKAQIRQAAEAALDFNSERAAFIQALESDDSKEGVAAFLEKRKAVYTGQ